MPSAKSKLKSFLSGPGVILISQFILFSPFLFASKRYVPGVATGDLPYFFKPMREFAALELAQGRFPFWNPYTYGGRPFIADPETCMFYPFTYLFAVFPSHLAVSWSYFFHFVIAGWGMYFLCRKLGASRPGSVAASFIFTWSAPHLLHMYAGHLTIVQAFAWTPWLIWSLDSFLDSLQWRHAALFGLFLSLHLLSGYPLYTYLAGWLLLAYGLTRMTAEKSWSLSGPVFIRIGTGAALGTGIFLTQALLTSELIQFSTRRANDLSFVSSYSFSVKNLVTLLAPNYFGQNAELFPNEKTYFGESFVWENSCYMGIAALIMVLGGFGKTGNIRFRFWLITFITSLVVALGPLTPVFEFCYSFLPGFSLFRGYGKAMTLACIAFAILAARGIDGATLKTNFKSFKYGALGVMGTLFILNVLAWIGPDYLPFWKNQLSGALTQWRVPAEDSLIKAFQNETRLKLCQALFIAICLLAAIWVMIRNNFSRQVISWVICLIVSTDLLVYAMPYMTPLDFSRYELPGNLKRLIKESPQAGRIFWDNASAANLSVPARLFSANGYETLPLEKYSKLTNAINGLPLNHKNNYLELSPNPVTLNFFSGSFLMRGRRPESSAEFKLLGNGVVGDKKYYLYQTPGSGKRFRIAHQALPLHLEFGGQTESDSKYRQSVYEMMSQFPGTAYVPKKIFDDALDIGPPESIGDTDDERIDIVTEAPGVAVVRAIIKAPGVLIYNDNYYPGWQAWINGFPANIFSVNSIMKGTLVEKGEHEVKFVFTPRFFHAGLSITVASFILITLLIAFNPRPIEPGKSRSL